MVRERPLPTAAYVSGGATIALAIGGAFFGALALQKHSDFVSANDGFHVDQATTNHRLANLAGYESAYLAEYVVKALGEASDAR